MVSHPVVVRPRFLSCVLRFEKRASVTHQDLGGVLDRLHPNSQAVQKIIESDCSVSVFRVKGLSPVSGGLEYRAPTTFCVVKDEAPGIQR